MIATTPFSVLFVCTGNVCRSVMAQAMLQDRAEVVGVELRATSAGLAAEGIAPPRRTVAVMRKLGLEVADHRSRRLSAVMIDEADLVLGVARAHAWEAVALRPSSVGRVFTLHEFVRLGDAVGSVGSRQPHKSWIESVHLDRQRLDMLNRDRDIDDPYGRSRRTYARVAAEIRSLVDRLSDQLFPHLGAVLPGHPPQSERTTGPGILATDHD